MSVNYVLFRVLQSVIPSCGVLILSMMMLYVLLRRFGSEIGCSTDNSRGFNIYLVEIKMDFVM